MERTAQSPDCTHGSRRTVAHVLNHFQKCFGVSSQVKSESIALLRWLEDERRWADRSTVLPPQLGSVERVELSPDGRWLLTSHSGVGAIRDDAIAAWWIRGGRRDLR